MLFLFLFMIEFCGILVLSNEESDVGRDLHLYFKCFFEYPAVARYLRCVFDSSQLLNMGRYYFWYLSFEVMYSWFKMIKHCFAD